MDKDADGRSVENISGVNETVNGRSLRDEMKIGGQAISSYLVKVNELQTLNLIVNIFYLFVLL